jgi:hypothetical protein
MAGTIVVGLPADTDAGNCFPLGCAYSGEYQQVYSAGQFAGPLTISDLEFYNTQYDSDATAMNSGTWDISLSTTSANWDTLSSTFANNIGSNNTLVFSGNLSQSWAFGDTLSIDLTTPFTYNPEKGNLLMNVAVSGATAPGGNIFFDTNSENDYIGRLYCSGGFCDGSTSGSVESGYGLVTGFSTTTAVIPEPSSLLLLVSGLTALGGFVRRKITF